MTAVLLRPDQTQKNRLFGHMISVAVGLLLNHFTALRYSLLSANRSTSWNSHNIFSEIPGSPTTPSPLSVLSQYKCTGIFSESPYGNHYTSCSPCAYIYYRYIITHILFHAQRHDCETSSYWVNGTFLLHVFEARPLTWALWVLFSVTVSQRGSHTGPLFCLGLFLKLSSLFAALSVQLLQKSPKRVFVFAPRCCFRLISHLASSLDLLHSCLLSTCLLHHNKTTTSCSKLTFKVKVCDTSLDSVHKFLNKKMLRRLKVLPQATCASVMFTQT